MRKLHNDPCLKLERAEIPVVNEHQFLGLVFDKKLTFIPHLKYLRSSCNKRLQLLHVIAHTELGADQGTLLKLYRSLIRSKLDYSSFIYQSARRTNSKILNLLCHGVLRLVLGSFRMSPVESLYAEANEAPANIRSNELATQYYTKLKLCPSNPAYNATFHQRYGKLFKKREKAIKPFGLRMLQESEISIKNIHQDISPETSPWILKKPEVILKLNELPPQKAHPSTYIEKFHHILSDYPEHLHVFTDGSKDHSFFQWKAPSSLLSTSFHNKFHNKFIIFSDSFHHFITNLSYSLTRSLY